MATLADMFSLSREIQHEGKTYALRAPNQLEQGKFQRWLEDKAQAAIDRRHFDSEAAKTAAQNELTRDCAAGVYEWGGEIASRAILSETGMAKLVSIICECPEAEARGVVQKQIATICDIMTAASTNDPKALAAALARLGLPSDFLSSGSATRRSTKRKKKSRR